MQNKSRRHLNKHTTRKNKTSKKYNKIKMSGAGGNNNILIIRDKKILKKSWKDGSTAWVVSGPDGFRFYSKVDENSDKKSEFNIENEKNLLDKLTPFIKDKKYSIHSNK